MDTSEIAHFLNRIPGFRGVIPANRRPSRRLAPGEFMVVNTQPLHVKRGHWIALFRNNNGVMELFDPLAQEEQNSRVAKLVEEETMVYNRLSVQPVGSNSCGMFVCFFLLLRAAGVSMSDAEKVLDNQDDAMVYLYSSGFFK